jgi:putative heme-binding domain-containing protein
VAKVYRISPPQPWRVERSEIWEKSGLNRKYFGTIEPRQDYMTATCGPLIYRESALPAEYLGNYFVCEAVSNLVHRDVLRGAGPVRKATRAVEGCEFLASADNWCSPVYLQAGPDGALYVVDMYRQIIEHAGADGGRDVPNVPLNILHKYGLRTGSTMGRIYRVAPAVNNRAAKPRLGRAPAKELAEALGSPAAWWRTTAQRLILEKPEAAAVEAIRQVASGSPHAAARLQALWTLDTLGKLDNALVAAALRHGSPGVRENALRMAETRFEKSPSLTSAVLALVDDPDPAVRYQLAFTLGEVPSPGRLKALATLIRKGGDDPYLHAAVLSSGGDAPLELYRAAAGGTPAAGLDAFLSETARVIGARLDKGEIVGLLDLIARQSRDKAAGPLRELAAGIRRRGTKTLDIPAAREPLATIRHARADEAARAADELAGLIHARSPEERKALTERSSRVALAEDQPVAERIQAIEALGAVASPEVITTLRGLLHPRLPEQVQLAALQALGEQSGPEVAHVLADAWRGLIPALRAKAAEIALGRKDRLGPLLEAVREAKIPADAFDPAQRARLLGSTDPAVATAAKAIFGEASRKLDPKVFEAFKGALDLRGDSTRGAAAFKKLCIACHKAGGEGAEVGPNLASVKSRPRDQILRDILYPSMAFTPQYHQYVLATNDGRLITGMLAASNVTSYTIRRQGGEEVTALRKDVEELSDTQVSLMPENLLAGLAPQEVADLLEFVKQVD